MTNDIKENLYSTLHLVILLHNNYSFPLKRDTELIKKKKRKPLQIFRNSARKNLFLKLIFPLKQ